MNIREFIGLGINKFITTECFIRREKKVLNVTSTQKFLSDGFKQIQITQKKSCHIRGK